MNSSFSLSRFGVMSLLSNPRVLRVQLRVHGDDVLGHRDLGAVVVDLRADVVPLRRERQRRKGTRDRHARRDRRILVRGQRFGVACDRNHPVWRGRSHRALGTQIVVVRIGIRHQRLVEEVVDRPRNRSRTLSSWS